MHGLVAQSPGPSPKREPHCAAASAWRPAQGLGVQAKVLGVPPEHVQFTAVLDGSQGGRAVVVVVVELLVVVVAVPQTPKSGFAFPGGGAGFMQVRLQQLTSVAHRWPSGLHPLARAGRGAAMTSAPPTARRSSVGVIRFARISGRDVMGFLRCASVIPTAVAGGCYQWG